MMRQLKLKLQDGSSESLSKALRTRVHGKERNGYDSKPCCRRPRHSNHLLNSSPETSVKLIL